MWILVHKLRRSVPIFFFFVVILTNAILIASDFTPMELQRRKLENKLSIAENPYESMPQKINALMSIIKDKELMKHPELRKEFKQRLRNLIENNKTKDAGGKFILIIGMMTQPPFYKVPPSKEEQQFFLNLLTDNHNFPVVRATSAYYLRNTSIPEIKEKVRQVAEKLYKEYIRDPRLKDSRAVGLLTITLGRIYKFNPDELLNAENPVKFLQEKKSKFLGN